jgi:diamine N-acetyltransferase
MKEDIITFKKIDKENLPDMLSLRVKPSQQNHVASNPVSIAQANYADYAWYRGIYLEDTPIGFVMIGKTKGQFFLWRFMIDERFQNQGYGRLALEKVIEFVKTKHQVRYFYTSCDEGINGPLGFYKKMGFKETGKMRDDEIELRIELEGE